MPGSLVLSSIVAMLVLAGAPLGASAQTSVPVCTVPDASFVEGDSGTLVASLRATCDAPLAQDLEYHVTTSDSTAVAPDDYIAVDTTAVASAGESELPVALEVVGDTLYEADETFTVTLDDASGTVAFAKPTATITIVDGDGRAGPCITLSDTTVSGSGTASTRTSWRGIRSDRFTVANCGADVHLNVRGTDASGAAGTWQLLPWNDVNASTCDLGLNTFRAVVDVWLTGAEGVGTGLSTDDTLLIGDADTSAPFTLRRAAASELSADIQPPCVGSVGLGDPMTMDITLTAVAP